MAESVGEDFSDFERKACGFPASESVIQIG